MKFMLKLKIYWYIIYIINDLINIKFDFNLKCSHIDYFNLIYENINN